MLEHNYGRFIMELRDLAMSINPIVTVVFVQEFRKGLDLCCYKKIHKNNLFSKVLKLKKKIKITFVKN